MFEEQAENKAVYRLKEIFKYQNVAIYALTFLVSMLSVKGQVMPFGLAMIAACVGESIPLVGVIISAIAGTAVTNASSIGNMLIVLAVYLFLVLFIKSKVAVEERNEAVKSGGKLFFAIFIVAFIKNFVGDFSFYDVFINTIAASLTYVYYKIFVNGLSIIRDFKIKSVFTIEELIAGFILISIASLAFSDITVFSFKLCHILIMFMIMLLGWKRGFSVGIITGVSIGLATCVVDGAGLIQVLMFVVAGILSGLLGKLGKISTAIAIILGHIVLTYCVKETGEIAIYFREIFIAMIGLLFVPKNVKINIEEILEKDKLLESMGDNRLEEGKEAEESQRLKNISNMFTNFMINQENKEIIKTNIEKDFLNNLKEKTNNIFYEEIANEENGIAKDICTTLIRNEIIVDNDLIEILKNHNNYVFMQDESIKNDLQEIIKIANRTFKVVKTNNIKIQEEKTKFEASNDKLGDNIKQGSYSKKEIKEKEIIKALKTKGITAKACNIKQLENLKYIVEIKLSSSEKAAKEKNMIEEIAELISKNIGTKMVYQKEKTDEYGEEYSQLYFSEDKYVLQVGSSKKTREGVDVSGNCSLQIKLADGKYLLAIADGKGLGERARDYSKLMLKLIKQLVIFGFRREEIIKEIKAKKSIFKEAEKHSTLDMAVLDLYSGKIDIIKTGACSTYIKNKKNIKKIQSETMPLSIIEGTNIQSQTLDIEDGDVVVMCSSGVANTKDKYGVWIEDFIQNASIVSVQKMSDLILSEAINNSGGEARDDMTIIVSKIVRRK